MIMYILLINVSRIPYAFIHIYHSALNGHSIIGGFIGCSLIHTISKGISTACYSGDVGVGYASTIHSQAKIISFKKQSSLGVLGIFLDTFIVCTFSIILIITTDTWQGDIDSNLLIQISLQRYFPYMNLFIT